MKAADLTGRRFGKLVALTYIPGKTGVKAQWLCACDCGNEVLGNSNELQGGKRVSCGCTSFDKLAVDITGQVFGELTVESLDSKSAGSRTGRKWLCRCSCGNTRVVSAGHLREGHITACLVCGKRLRYERAAAAKYDTAHAQDGMRFGSYTVIGPVSGKEGGKSGRLCRCVCGSEKVVALHCLRNGRQLSCRDNCLGRRKALFALKKRRKEEPGTRYGKLVVTRIFRGPDGNSWAVADCDCGTTGFKVALASLKTGNTKGCGCLKWIVPEHMRGKNHPWYKHGRSDEERLARRNFEGKDKFISDILRRDDYTCAACGSRGGRLAAHHIKPWAHFPSHRFVKWNHVALCKGCHDEFHSRHGRDNAEMWREFIQWVRAKRKETGYGQHQHDIQN